MSGNDSSSHHTWSAEILLARLERISADSPWAHQASGIRASLAKRIDRNDTAGDDFRQLVKQGYLILEKAAGEFPED